jgi:hypothetical protein
MVLHICPPAGSIIGRALTGRQRERRYEMPLSSTLEEPERELDDDDWDDDEEFGTEGDELELDEFDDIDEDDDEI